MGVHRFLKHLTAVVLASSALHGPVAMRIASADTLDDVLARGKMVVAIDPTFAPYEFTDDQGNITGYDPEVLARVAKAMGVEVEYQKMGFTGIIPGLIAGSFDFTATALAVTAERAQKVTFTVPVSHAVNAVARRKGDTSVKSAQPEDLAGLRLGVKATTQPEQVMLAVSEELESQGMKPIEFLSIETVEQQTAALVNKRVDFVVDDIAVLGAVVRKRPEANLEIIGEIGPVTYIAWGARKDDTRLAKALSEQIIELQQNGELATLQKKYFGVSFDLPVENFIPAE
ncbi:MAG: transporter substrate-binding domain-containing protein [Gammaproteobacteria bacterium]